MPRRKQYLDSKIKKTDVSYITYPDTHIIKSADYFYFEQLYPKQPKRSAIMNILRKHIIDAEWNNDDYDYLSEKYDLNDKERILRSLNVEPERHIIESLCDHFKISPIVSLHDIIANYDFEQKDIAHKRGRITTSARKQFLEEFSKSWDEKTVACYEHKITQYKDSLYEYDTDEWIEQLEDRHEKELFLNLRRIYAEYPDYVEAFCNSFSEFLT